MRVPEETMLRPSSLFHVLLPALCLLGVAANAHAQASLTGVVRDTSGAVLPGVTVEAASPVLIEKVRTAVTDGTGQYRIVDLQPGAYTVTFTLTGFNVVRREGIELTGSFTATVNADLRVGSLEETITVTGESPIVDVQSTRRQQVLEREIVTAIPTGRNYYGLAVLVPGIYTATNDVGGIAGPATVTFANHGGPTTEGRLQVDGMGVGSAVGGSGVSYYVADTGNAEEISFTTSGGLGEAEVGGPVMSIVPRTGGNTIRGSFVVNGAGSGMQGSNYTDAIKAAGLRAPEKLIKVWDVNGAFGGPVKKDRLWFFWAVRHQGNRRYVTGMYVNKNMGNPNAWTYEPDLTQQAITDGTWKNTSMRLTWQAAQRSKFNIFWDEQRVCLNCIWGGDATTSPEASSTTQGHPTKVQQITWTSPATNRLLLEAGFGSYNSHFGGRERATNPRALIRVVEQAGSIPGLTYRSQNWSSNKSANNSWRASASYITGAHSLKVGYTGGFIMYRARSHTNDQRLAYRFNNGVPNQLTMSPGEYDNRARVTTAAFYVQEQYTRGRMTLQGAVRYDRAGSYALQNQLGPDRFVPAIVFPRTDGVSTFNDINPRAGVAYNLFGNGKTALKANIGRYVEAATHGARYSATNPLNRIATSTTRAWTDGNRNYIADCDLLNPVAQDFRASGGDFCGAFSASTFGTAAFNDTFDPAILEGYRPADWGLGVSIQQEVLPRVSVEVGYFERWWSNFQVTDNRAVSPSDYDPFSFTAPVDSRLPGGGGFVVNDLYDLRPAKFGLVDNYITAASNFGDRTQRYRGVDVSVQARLRNGLTFQGGTATGRTITDQCDVTPDSPSQRFCRVVPDILTQFKALGAYTVPKVDVQLSATFQSKPGAQLAANYNVPNAVVQPSLGRPLSGNAANVSVNLVEPGTLYGDRINQLDFRVAKVLRYGRTRTQVGLDVYNMLNSSAIQTYNQTFGASWLTPTLVLPARFMKVSAQIDF
jgi:hypothetical protein